MRIVNIMLGKNLGGLEQVAIDYHVNLAKRGHQILTILRAGAAIDTSNCLKDSLHYLELSNIPFKTSLAIKSAIKSFAGDIVLAHGKRPLSYLKSMRSLKIPRVFIAHNYRTKKDCLKMDHCIAVSTPVRDQMIELGLAPERCHVVHNMTTMTTVKTSIELSDPPLFGILSRLHTVKGIDIFLHAFYKLRAQNIEARAIIAGNGPAEEQLKALTSELGLEQHIDFVGWVKDTKQFYKAIDIFVLPSREEPFGLTVIDAMAAGVPMIITNCKGPASFLRDGKEAFFVEKENISDLAGALYTLLEDHHLRADLQYHQSLSAKKFTPESVTKNLETILYDIMAATK